MGKVKDYTEMSEEDLKAEAERIMDQVHELTEAKEEIRQKQLALHKEYEPIALELTARAAGGSVISPEGIESAEELGNLGG